MATARRKGLRGETGSGNLNPFGVKQKSASGPEKVTIEDYH
jgi:hypothetical protein